MMGDMSEDGPPSNKRAKIGPGGMTPTDNGGKLLEIFC